jgi:hypothetical protein
MIRGHSGPPDHHLVHREPLRPDELDRQVIKGMRGFEFGTEDEIERKLVQILESEGYIRAVQYWERKRGGSGAMSNFGTLHQQNAISLDSSSTKSDPHIQPAPPAPSKKSRPFSVFDYYRRKLFSPSSNTTSNTTTSPPASSLSRSSPGSQNHLPNNGGTGYDSGSNTGEWGGEGMKEPVDPTRGFHPLLSMYYLAREKMERDRVYGPGQFASSNLSVVDGADEEGERKKGIVSPGEEEGGEKVEVEVETCVVPPSSTLTGTNTTGVVESWDEQAVGKQDHTPSLRLSVSESGRYFYSYDSFGASGKAMAGAGSSMTFTTEAGRPEPGPKDLGVPHHHSAVSELSILPHTAPGYTEISRQEPLESSIQSPRFQEQGERFHLAEGYHSLCHALMTKIMVNGAEKKLTDGLGEDDAQCIVDFLSEVSAMAITCD